MINNISKRIRKDETIKNSKLLTFKNDEGHECIFYGHKGEDADVPDNPVNAKWFNYTNNEIWNYVNNDTNEIEATYVGELIEFKKEVDAEFFDNIFESIFNGIVENIWPSLFDALTDLSEILDINSQEELDGTVKGYIGEICFMYWLLNNCDDEEFVNKVFESYQSKEAKKHDFIVRSNSMGGDVRLEIKSSQGEKGTFMMKADQQMDNFEDKLFYGFVRYELSGNDNSLNMKSILNEVYNNVKNPNLKMPNHLIINSKKFNFEKIGIKKGSIKVYIVDNKELPSFDDMDKSIVKSINYKLDLSVFISKAIETSGYSVEKALDELKREVNK